MVETRTEIELELAAEVFRAKRETPALGSEKHPTRWDVRHQDLDDLLTKWQQTH